jgi:hypothetical protein
MIISIITISIITILFILLILIENDKIQLVIKVKQQFNDMLFNLSTELFVIKLKQFIKNDWNIFNKKYNNSQLTKRL